MFPCVDRTVQCSILPSFLNIDVEYLHGQVEDEVPLWNTTVQLTCSEENYYFDFPVPDDLVSFHYSNNINSTTLACNEFG